MAEYLGPATDNQADVISTSNAGHIVPDRYATGDDDCKFQSAHPKDIDNSLDRYRGETPEGFKRD
jgi:hypothetical protein